MAKGDDPREPPSLLLLEEVAKICRVKAVKTVSRWIRDGIRGVRLPASRIGRQCACKVPPAITGRHAWFASSCPGPSATVGQLPWGT